MSLHSSAGVVFSAHNDVSQESQRSNSQFILFGAMSPLIRRNEMKYYSVGTL